MAVVPPPPFFSSRKTSELDHTIVSNSQSWSQMAFTSMGLHRNHLVVHCIVSQPLLSEGTHFRSEKSYGTSPRNKTMESWLSGNYGFLLIAQKADVLAGKHECLKCHLMTIKWKFNSPACHDTSSELILVYSWGEIGSFFHGPADYFSQVMWHPGPWTLNLTHLKRCRFIN